MIIDVVCATQGDAFNGGMHSVDLAASDVLKRIQPDAQVRFWRLWANETTDHKSEDENTYRAIWPDPGRLDGDIKLLWGDFLQDKQYILKQSHNLTKYFDVDKSTALSFVNRVLLNKTTGSETQQPTIIYGSTLIHQSPNPQGNGDYYDLFRNLIRTSWGVFFRDPFSAFTAQQFLDHRSLKPCLGTDCALLLNTESLDRTEVENAHTCGLFFGRTDPRRRLLYRFSKIPYSILGQFAIDVCERMSYEPRWIPWAHGTGMNDIEKPLIKRFPHIRPWTCPRNHLGQLISSIRKCSLVITDTYHLCVNSWRCGVPAICVGEAVPRVPWVTGSAGMPFVWRDKRQVFFQMYDAQQYYVYLEELNDKVWRKRRLDQIQRALSTSSQYDPIVDKITKHSKSSEFLLADVLKSSAV